MCLLAGCPKRARQIAPGLEMHPRELGVRGGSCLFILIHFRSALKHAVAAASSTGGGILQPQWPGLGAPAWLGWQLPALLPSKAPARSGFSPTKRSVSEIVRPCCCSLAYL